jgi:hypothetical protein
MCVCAEAKQWQRFTTDTRGQSRQSSDFFIRFTVEGAQICSIFDTENWKRKAENSLANVVSSNNLKELVDDSGLLTLPGIVQVHATPKTFKIG